jgi:cytochrome c-type biogenesis protein CcmH
MAGFLFIGGVAVVAVLIFAALGLPLLRGDARGLEDDRAASLRARLDAIGRDLGAGLIGEGEADEAEIEAKRAALAVTHEEPASKARAARFGAIAFLALTPVAVALIYLGVGAPSLIDPKPQAASAPPDQNAIAAMPEDQRRGMIEGMVASLAARLETSPDDADGWRMLARSELVLERPVDSAASYRRLFALEAGTVEDWRNFSTALIAAYPADKFPVDPEFLRSLDEIDRRAPGDAMVLFYRGGAAREGGDPARAVELWTALLEAMPADAPVRGTLTSLIEEARAEAAKP